MSAENLRGASILGIVSGLFILLGSVALLLSHVARVMAVRCLYGTCIIQTAAPRFLSLGLLIPLFVGLLSGALVLVAALQIGRGRAPSSWGAVALAFSLVSLLAGGGFLIGAILGIVAGALALAARPPAKGQSEATSTPGAGSAG